MSSSNNLKKGLDIIELEDRLETVQLAVAAASASNRCDSCDCPKTAAAAE